ncbi:MAG: tetratricopeptide repeat protein [Spirochaetales bacterium]|nr:tetratricopeptide repeat protein [Spirochaetales bacterium]
MRSTPIKAIRIIFYLFLLLFMLWSCASTVDPHSPDLEKVEYFQLSYEALDNNNYDLAISYYQAFKEKFPEDIDGNTWADYEIAFIYHKKGDNSKSLELFQALLAKYEEAPADSMPQGPKVLAQKVMEKINQE